MRSLKERSGQTVSPPQVRILIWIKIDVRGRIYRFAVVSCECIVPIPQAMLARRHHGGLIKSSMGRLVMEKVETNRACPNVSHEEQEAIEIITRIREVRGKGTHEEAQRMRIELDEYCRRDSSDVLFADSIRRHTLIEDNPCSG